MRNSNTMFSTLLTIVVTATITMSLIIGYGIYTSEVGIEGIEENLAKEVETTVYFYEDDHPTSSDIKKHIDMKSYINDYRTIKRYNISKIRADAYNISAIPTLIKYSNGIESKRISGELTKEQADEFIDADNTSSTAIKANDKTKFLFTFIPIMLFTIVIVRIIANWFIKIK